jgi:two-component system cell cycle sensor histidine kinase/response regulator CckA
MYTVLFADDADIVRELFCDALRRSGYCVLEAPDGAKALSVARRHPGPIHLLITDVMMPQLRGPELWRALRASHPEAAVLFISGYAADEVHFDAPFLQKPFTPARLLARVIDILQASEAPRAVADSSS